MLHRVGHRPFPIPESRWTLGQTWEHTFWAHWPVSTVDLRQLVPDELEIEEHDGSGWLGIQFFRVRSLRARGALPVPGISAFLQLNVRTYVCGPDGLPGQLMPGSVAWTSPTTPTIVNSFPLRTRRPIGSLP